MKKQIVILAAGKGSRMKSKLPKVMHEVGGKPMLVRVVENCAAVTDDLILVYSDHLEKYLPRFSNCKFVKQRMQLGTAHAVASALDQISPDKNIGVIYGDNPLITPQIIENLFTYMDSKVADLVTLAFEHQEENQYGRIVCDAEGKFERIVEAKFATPEEISITLCNSGIMSFAPGALHKYLPACLLPKQQNPERELYLTDIVEVCVKDGGKVEYFTPHDSDDVVGVNTQEELEYANLLARRRK